MPSLWKDGPYKKVCRVKEKSRVNKLHEQQNRHKITAYIYAEEPELEMFSLLSDTEKQMFQVNFTVNKQDLLMEVDTGATVSIISHARYKQLFTHVPVEGARAKLKTYTDENIAVLGQFSYCAIRRSSK